MIWPRNTKDLSELVTSNLQKLLLGSRQGKKEVPHAFLLLYYYIIIILLTTTPNKRTPYQNMNQGLS
jgi:hypothetical protein